ncbi:MAG: site-specific integrase [Thermoplasmataceae archaeon]|jgi:hypothetical protein
MTGPRKKYESLMENEDIKRWYNEMARASRITADTYLRRLGSFCNWASVKPWELAEKNEKGITDLMSDYVTYADTKGMAGQYILSTIKAVKSWLTYNGIKLTRKVKVGNGNSNTTLTNERIPTQTELKKIFASGDPRSRVACVLMAHSGTRPEVLGDYTGDNGLKLKDFPELKIEDGKAIFERIPAMIIVRPELSKARKQYITFLGKEGCFYVSAYLEQRIAEGEILSASSPLITPSKFALRSEISHIRTINIGDLIRQSIRASGFKGRPYVLRSYFDTQLMLAESKGLILRDYRQFFMGHVGDIEHRYTVNKQRLPEDVIEDMRQSYAKASKFLETEEHGIKEEDVAKITSNTMRETAIMILETAYGIRLSDKEKEELMALDTNDLQERLKQIFSDKKADILNNGNKHKTIPEKELESYLNKGWELVQIYPKGDKAVIKLP